MRVRPFLMCSSLTVCQMFRPCGAAGQAATGPHGAPHALLSRSTAVAAGFLLAVAFMGDEGLRIEAQESRGADRSAVARVGNAFGEPRVVLPTLGATYLAGELTGNRALRRIALRAGEAATVAGAITMTLKFTVGRSRPRHGDDDQFRPFSGRNSFPSGHTTVAFAVATAIADETPEPWTDIALYGAATLTAFARVINDRHWTSDVLAGALVGHLSARWLARRHGGLTVRPGGIGVSFAF